MPVDQPFSAGEYGRRAHAEIDALLEQDRRPIVVGGTGLYLRAALADLDLRPPVPPEIRARRRRELETQGAPALHAELAAKAPRPLRRSSRRMPSASRARSSCWTRATSHPPAISCGRSDTRHPTLLAGLVMDREALNAKIDERVEEMVAQGAADEVRRAANASPTARKALGFEELLNGDVEAMQRNTRRYAKRQLTWMRKLPDVQLVDTTDRAPEDVAAELHAMIRACDSRSGRRSATTT